MVEFPFITLTPTSDPNSSLWCGLTHGFFLTFSFSSPLFLCARTLVHEGLVRGLIAYGALAASTVLFLFCIFSGQVELLQVWSDWEPFLYGFGFFLTLQVTVNLLRGPRQFSFPFLISTIVFGSLCNPPLILPVTRFIMRGEMLNVNSFPYLIGVFIGLLGFGMLGAVVGLRSFQWFILYVSNAKPKVAQLVSTAFAFIPKTFSTGESLSGSSNPGFESQDPRSATDNGLRSSIMWDFSPQSQALALRRASNFLLVLNLGLLITGCTQYTWRAFVQYPFEFTTYYKMQRQFGVYDTGIRYRERNLPVSRHNPVDRYIQDRSLNYLDEKGENTQPPLTLLQQNEIYLRYKKHIFQRINQFFINRRITFRTPHERLISSDQIHTMRAYQSMYGDKNEALSMSNSGDIRFKELKNNIKGLPKFSYVRPSTD